MAWHTIQATDDLTVELWPSGEADNQLLLKIRSKATEGEVVIYLEEARHLIDALVNGATDLRRLRLEKSDKGLIRQNILSINTSLQPPWARTWGGFCWDT